MAQVTTYPMMNLLTGGELSEQVEARIDLSAYQRGFRTQENFLTNTMGGVEKRPGLVFVSEVIDSADNARLIPFTDKRVNKYILELGDEAIKIWNAETLAVVQTITSAVLHDHLDLREVRFAAAPSLMYLYHEDYKIVKLYWNTTVWAVANPTFSYGSTGIDLDTTDKRPACGCFHQGRMGCAGSKTNPLTAWMSNLQPLGTAGTLYETFNLKAGTDVEDTDAVEMTFAAQFSDRFEWMLSKGNVIALGGQRGEWTLSGGDGPLTPTNKWARSNTSYGSAEVQAIAAGDTLIFVQAGGRKVRELMFSNEMADYKAVDLTMLASHITEGGIVELAYSQTPDPTVWAIRADGTLLAMTYDRMSEVASWHRYVTDGQFESVATMRVGEEDRVFVIVKRTINGVSKRYIEYFSVKDWGSDQADAYFVDCGVKFDNGSAKTVTAMTQADPIHVTAASHGFLDNDYVRFKDVGGMTQVNDEVFVVKNKTTNEFDLYLEDGSDGVNAKVFTLDCGDVATPTDFAVGDTLTGADSAKTCTVLQNLGGGKYLCNMTTVATSFTDGEVIGNGVDSVDCAAGFPTVAFQFSAYTSGGTVEKVQKTFTSLSHIEGKTVTAYGDRGVMPDEVVTSATVTFDDYMNHGCLGLKYTGYLKTMPVEAPTGDGTTQGRKKRIDKVTLRLVNSLGGYLGDDFDHLIPLSYRGTSDYMGEAQPLYNGDLAMDFNGDYETKAYICIKHEEPLPFSLQSIMPRMALHA